MERKKLLKTCECGECKTPPTRPTCFELADAKTDICALVNDIATKRRVPFYLLEIVLADVYKQVVECAKVEREAAALAYERKLKEFNEKGKGEGNE